MVLLKIGEHIKQARIEKGISQEQLSLIAKVKKEQISKIENGQLNVHIQTINRLCNVLGIEFQLKHEKVKLKPFVKWAGGKTQLLDKINEFKPPKFNRYFEPFVGGGAVLFDLMPFKATINDMNYDLICVYKCLKNKAMFKDFIDMLIEHEKNHNEKYYYNIRDLDRKDNFKESSETFRAARMVYLNKTCYNGLYRVNPSGYFNVPSAKRKKVNTFDRENMYNLHKYFLINDIKILSGDYSEAIKYARKGDFIYFDPPYDSIKNTKSFTSYTANNFNTDDQIKLAKLYKELSDRGIYLMLSNHNTDLIKELYSEFNIKVVKARRYINCNGDKRGDVEEVIITNY